MCECIPDDYYQVNRAKLEEDIGGSILSDMPALRALYFMKEEYQRGFHEGYKKALNDVKRGK